MAKKLLTKLSLKRGQSCKVARISLLAKLSSIFGYAFYPFQFCITSYQLYLHTQSLFVHFTSTRTSFLVIVYEFAFCK